MATLSAVEMTLDARTKEPLADVDANKNLIWSLPDPVTDDREHFRTTSG